MHPTVSIPALACKNFSMPPKYPFFIGGDFNLKYPFWDSSSTYISPHASDLLQRVSQKNLSLLNPSETPTHRNSGRLDLAFYSQVGATYTIRSDLHATSNHESLISIIPQTALNTRGFEGRLCFDPWNKKLFLTLLGNSENVPHIFLSLSLSTNAEIETNDIVQTIQIALIASCHRTKQNTRGTV